LKKGIRVFLIIGFILLSILLVYAAETNLTTNEVFTSLKDNNAKEATALFTVDNKELVSKESFKLYFNEVCGHVNNYSILVESVCSKKQPIINITITKCDSKTIYNDSLKSNQDICPSPCFGNPKEGCYLETDKTTIIDVNYTCYKPFDSVTTGIKNYKIMADITPAVCKNTGGFGYEIDWIPCLNITNPLTASKVNYCQDKWDWWNISLVNRYNISNLSTTNMAMVINGTYGYTIDGKKNFIWFNPKNLTGSSAVYNGSGNIYSVANLTTQGSYDNPRGGLNKTPTTIYGADAVFWLHSDNNGSWNGSANTGSWIDSTGNIPEGSLYAGSPGYVNDSMIGGSYNLSGTAKILWNDNDLLDKGTGESISFVMWLKIDVNQEQGPFGKKDSAGTGWYVYTGGGPYFQGGMRTDTGTDCNLDKASFITVGTWNHIVWLVDGATNRSGLYINGTSVANITKTSCAGSSNNADPFRLGTEQNQYGTPFNGEIDEFRIYKRALNWTEINEDFNNTMRFNNILSVNDVYIPADITAPVIIINAPADFNWTNNQLPSINFTVTDNNNNSMRCDVTFNANYIGFNVSTLNNTPTVITINTSLAYFNVYTYGVNCTDGINVAQNDSRTLYLYNGTAGTSACNMGCVGLAPGCYAYATAGCTLITH
jgi:hypothetical protein